MVDNAGRPRSFPPTLIEQYAEHEPWKIEDASQADINKQVLFTFRSNVMYNCKEDANPPLYGQPISFAENDFLQVVKVASPEWWIARVIGSGAVCGYIPSPLCFFKKHDPHYQDDATQRKWIHRVSASLVYRKGQGGQAGHTAIPRNNPRVFKSLSSVATMFDSLEIPPKGTIAADITTRWRNRKMSPYDLAPNVRPLVLVGPSSPGFEITDKMQQSLVAYLCASFPNKCTALDIDKFADGNGGFKQDNTKAKKSKTKGPQRLNAQQMNAVFDVAATGVVPILCTKHQNVDMLRRSPVMPIIVFLRIGSSRVLSKLLKSREQQQGFKAQMNTSEKLSSLNPLYFDIILTHSKLDQSCYELAAFVDAYVKDIKRTPIIDATLLHTAKSGEEDEDLASPVPSPQAGAAPHLNYLD